MTSNHALMQSIRLRLGSRISTDFTAATSQADLYEAYIFSLLLRAAHNEGANSEYGGSILFHDAHDRPTDHLLFRRSPGQIYAATQPFTHAVVSFANKPVLEVHIGIKAIGRLKVPRECDVAVIFHQKAITYRSQRRIPKAADLLFAIECKHVDTLTLENASEFLGLTADLRVNEAWFFVASSASDTVAKMLANDHKAWHHNVLPSHPNNVNRLIYAFQTVFQNFKAKH